MEITDNYYACAVVLDVNKAFSLTSLELPPSDVIISHTPSPLRLGFLTCTLISYFHVWPFLSLFCYSSDV